MYVVHKLSIVCCDFRSKKFVTQAHSFNKRNYDCLRIEVYDK